MQWLCVCGSVSLTSILRKLENYNTATPQKDTFSESLIPAKHLYFSDTIMSPVKDLCSQHSEQHLRNPSLLSNFTRTCQKNWERVILLFDILVIKAVFNKGLSLHSVICYNFVQFTAISRVTLCPSASHHALWTVILSYPTNTRRPMCENIGRILHFWVFTWSWLRSISLYIYNMSYEWTVFSIHVRKTQFVFLNP
jgi:hypothetical protein